MEKNNTMKIKTVPMIAAIGLSALIAYGLFALAKGGNKELIGIGTGVMSLVTLITAIGVSYKNGRTATNVRTVGMLFFTIGIVSNIAFSLWNLPRPAYIVTNGMLILLFLLIANFIAKAKY
jgi:hypothetical protein|tara:strand:+ start:787 stop:1149 length:363 start_codon:yes stop_codon:yes gene_type:complete